MKLTIIRAFFVLGLTLAVVPFTVQPVKSAPGAVSSGGVIVTYDKSMWNLNISWSSHIDLMPPLLGER